MGGFVGLSVVSSAMSWSWERVFLFSLFSCIAFRPHSYLVMSVRELLVLIQKIMSVCPVFVNLREGVMLGRMAIYPQLL